MQAGQVGRAGHFCEFCIDRNHWLGYIRNGPGRARSRVAAARMVGARYTVPQNPQYGYQICTQVPDHLGHVLVMNALTNKMGWRKRHDLSALVMALLLLADVATSLHAEALSNQSPTTICKSPVVLKALDAFVNGRLYAFLKTHPDESTESWRHYSIQAEKVGGRESVSQKDTIECTAVAISIDATREPERDEPPLPLKTIRYDVGIFDSQLDITIIDVRP